MKARPCYGIGGVMALLVGDKNDDFWRFMDAKRGGDKSVTGNRNKEGLIVCYYTCKAQET